MSNMKKNLPLIIISAVVLLAVGATGAWYYGNQLVASEAFTLEEVMENQTTSESQTEAVNETEIASTTDPVIAEAVETVESVSEPVPEVITESEVVEEMLEDEPEAIDLSEGFGLINFAGRNGFGLANGTFHDWTFTRVEVNGDALASSVVELEVDLTSLDTRNTRRDNHLKSDDFFDVVNFPTATLKFYNFAAQNVTDDGLGLYTATLDFNLHGVTKTYEVEFKMLATAMIQVEGSLEVNRLDFGVGEPHNGFDPTSPENKIQLIFSATIPANL